MFTKVAEHLLVLKAHVQKGEGEKLSDIWLRLRMLSEAITQVIALLVRQRSCGDETRKQCVHDLLHAPVRVPNLSRKSIWKLKTICLYPSVHHTCESYVFGFRVRLP